MAGNRLKVETVIIPGDQGRVTGSSPVLNTKVKLIGVGSLTLWVKKVGPVAK